MTPPTIRDNQSLSFPCQPLGEIRYRPIAALLLAGLMLVVGGPVQADPDDQLDVQLVSLETPDGVSLSVMYYPAAVEVSEDEEDKEKQREEAERQRMEAVPIMILHHWKGQAADYEPLARYLQSRGHAVVVPDLRGHGESRDAEQNPDLFKDPDIFRMVSQDVETVKKFLVTKNDQKELNIEKLCVIGVEFGGLLALNWAVKDWSWPDLLTRKQGKDVKALVLVSPLSKKGSLETELALKHPDVRSKLSVLLIVGAEDSRAMRTTKRLYGKLKQYHPKPPADQEQSLRTLYLFDHGTNLQGLKLLEQEDLRNPLIIEKFIEERLVAQRYPWQKRLTSP